MLRIRGRRHRQSADTEMCGLAGFQRLPYEIHRLFGNLRRQHLVHHLAYGFAGIERWLHPLLHLQVQASAIAAESIDHVGHRARKNTRRLVNSTGRASRNALSALGHFEALDSIRRLQQTPLESLAPFRMTFHGVAVLLLNRKSAVPPIAVSTHHRRSKTCTPPPTTILREVYPRNECILCMNPSTRLKARSSHRSSTATAPDG